MDRKDYTLKWFAILPATFAVVAVAVPVLMVRVPEIGFALQRGFALVCHQQPDRSFFLFGGSVAVCSRCLGIYLGATAGLVLRAWRPTALRWLTIAVSASVVEWATEIAGLHGNWMWMRFGLGFAVGAAAAMLVLSTWVVTPQAAS